jgi:aminoglycoside phosphotransferase (APT) family kinase protein
MGSSAEAEPYSVPWIADRIERVSGTLGVEHGLVVDMVALPGNSGRSYSFSLRNSEHEERCVIRLAPPGVRGRHVDLLRQVPLTQALRRHQVSIPAVLWSSGPDGPFDTTAIIVEYVDARPLHFWNQALSTELPAAGAESLVLAAVDVLAQIHATPWEDELREWDTPRTARDEVAAWDSVLIASGDGPMVQRGQALAAWLHNTADATSPTGIMHGDYQTNNILFHHGAVRAVVDWELAGIGPQLLDVGWLQMVLDPSCWAEEFAERIWIPTEPDLIAERYWLATGIEVTPWWRALACYRFGAIVAYNASLDRTGKRPDNAYTLLSSSVPALFGQAEYLLK